METFTSSTDMAKVRDRAIPGTPDDIRRMYNLEELRDEKLFNRLMPVGYIYISLSGTSPETLFGGKWEQLQGSFQLNVSGTWTDTNAYVWKRTSLSEE